MGLTTQSVGTRAIDQELVIKKITDEDKVIALAGNPNVGKSTVFNALTGLNQHTGNWPGKTVTNAQGIYKKSGKNYVLVDLPGTYSLLSNSTEEEIARDFICFGNADCVIVVCDATCLERNLNLVLQTLEITGNVVVCVNLMDEAKRKGINVDLKILSEKLGVTVIGTSASSGDGLFELMEAVSKVDFHAITFRKPSIQYTVPIEKAIQLLEPYVNKATSNLCMNTRWLSLKLLDSDKNIIKGVETYLGFNLMDNNEITEQHQLAIESLKNDGIKLGVLTDVIVSCIVESAEEICKYVIKFEKKDYQQRDRKIDRLLTNKFTGFPIMIGLLGLIFWLTITGSNVPSSLLSDAFFWIEEKLLHFAIAISIPSIIYEPLILGVYRVVVWVISVMLPPMAIFFPLFTLLEDLGYLPRVAFNLDNTFKKCKACGKQALTMCMGFGCNAAGVIGCRIIDSPRERLIAIITNNFVPCNGRFPTLIAIISMFFVATVATPLQSVIGTVILTGVVLLGISMTFLMSYFLSKTILKGQPSSFTLELPPYRTPRIGQIIIRSIFDRTLFVLGRAIVVAAPTGLIIWILSNVILGEISLLAHCNQFLDPFGKLLGMDGVIIFAFILGLPANEIVVPIIIMSYMATGHILEMDSLVELKQLFVSNGWTWVTAVSTLLFCMFHWPCSTTCLTIKKETGSWKWTALSFFLPTIIGVLICFIFTFVTNLFLIP